MKFLLVQCTGLILSVIILYYFSTLSYFTPRTITGDVAWYNVLTVLGILGVAIQAAISIIIFCTQKFTVFGRKEFPPYETALLWGVGISILCLVLILLNIFHLLSLQWGLVIVGVAVLALWFLKGD